jgi:hypothetical protein
MGKMNENEREKNLRNVFSLLLCIERYTAREVKKKVSTSIDFCCCQSDSLHRVYCGEKNKRNNAHGLIGRLGSPSASLLGVERVKEI